MGIFKTTDKSTEQADIVTSFNIWNLLVARYQSMENAQLFYSFVHDKDLQIVLDALMRVFANQIKALEKETRKYNIKAPTRPALMTKTKINVKEVTDKFILTRTINDVLNELFSLNRSVRSTLTSDRLRGMFQNYLFQHAEQYEKL